ncbi:hypothetical protein [Bathymodiolus japonicus methanotrophic gill symbiont]|uniref:hypothetical protein n=1 Tax=Bathymodiolus japonicus methanotrophic gill symbiont TaxID=113269 RepID=UPI001C8E494A|nr:hypothetical protein [Bathymodiolus japonicus methanotrophic gill symbiont]
MSPLRRDAPAIYLTKFRDSSRVLLAHVESANFPVAYQGPKITTSLSSVSILFNVESIKGSKHYVKNLLLELLRTLLNVLCPMYTSCSIHRILESSPGHIPHQWHSRSN